MKIDIITLGGLKDIFYQEAAGHYLKLLKVFCDTNMIELKDEPVKKHTDLESILAIEAEKIERSLKHGRPCIVLDEKGKSMNSVQFAHFLQEYDQNGAPVQFVIGGAMGLSASTKTKATHLLRLSDLTLPHQLARVVLLEQLYRAFSIMKGKKYHY